MNPPVYEKEQTSECVRCGGIIDRFGSGPWWHLNTFQTVCVNGTTYAQPKKED